MWGVLIFDFIWSSALFSLRLRPVVYCARDARFRGRSTPGWMRLVSDRFAYGDIFGLDKAEPSHTSRCMRASSLVRCAAVSLSPSMQSMQSSATRIPMSPRHPSNSYYMTSPWKPTSRVALSTTRIDLPASPWAVLQCERSSSAPRCRLFSECLTFGRKHCWVAVEFARDWLDWLMRGIISIVSIIPGRITYAYGVPQRYYGWPGSSKFQYERREFGYAQCPQVSVLTLSAPLFSQALCSSRNSSLRFWYPS